MFKYNINYDYGADDDYITLDMTSFYRTMLINTTFYEFSLIAPWAPLDMPFNNYALVPSNLYYIECPLTEDIEDYSVIY